jgi:uncharacterized protein involved in outer membrane biogenesis
LKSFKIKNTYKGCLNNNNSLILKKIKGVLVKKFLYGLLALVFTLLVVAVVVPFFIDLNNYKPQITAAVKDNIGREMKIEGAINLSFLPSPSLEIHNVSLANAENGTHSDFLKLEKLQVKISLADLLRAKIQITKLGLTKPVIYLEKLPNGKYNWDFDVAKKEQTQIQEKATSEASFASPRVEIQDVSITNATLIYHEGKEDYKIEDLSLKVKSKNFLEGPFDVAGSFSYKNLPISLEMETGSLKASILDLKTTLKAADNNVSIRGLLTVDSKQFKGDVEGNAPRLGELLKTLNITKENLPGVFKAASIDFSSKINASPSGAELNQLQLTIDKRKLQGSSKLELAQDGTLKADLQLQNLPEEGKISLKLLKSGQNTQGTVKLSSENIEKLLKWIAGDDFKDVLKAIETHYPPSLKKLDFNTSFDFKESLLALNALSLSFPSSRIDGKLSYSMASQNHLSYDLQISSVVPFLKLADVTLLKNPGPCKLKGELNFSKSSLPFSLKLMIEELNASVSGHLNEHKFNVDINHPKLKSVVGWIKENPPALGAFKIRTVVGTGPKRYTFEHLKGSLEYQKMPLGFEGGVVISTDGPRPYIKGNLDLNSITLKSETTAGSASATEVPSKKGEGSLPHQQPAGHVWSSEPLGLDALKSFDGDFKVEIPQIKKEDIEIKDVSLHAKVASGVLEITKTNASIFGGRFSGSGRLSPQQSLLKMTMAEAHLDRLPVKTSKVKVIKGTAGFDADLTTQGGSLLAMVSHLNGVVKFKAKNGVIQGFDLQALTDLVSNLNAVQALASIPKILGGGETNFSDLETTVNFTSGIGTFTHFALITPGVDTKMAGKIDLPRYWLDSNWQIKLTKKENLPSLKMHLFGPIDNPQRDIDMAELRNYLVKNVFEKLTGKGNPLENLLGIVPKEGTKPQQGQSSDSSSVQPQSQPSPEKAPLEKIIEKPEEALKDVLKGLF